MSRHPQHDNATSNVLAWSHHAANVESAAEEDASADADEPPDLTMPRPKMTPEFRRTSLLIKSKETHASLLTRALQSASESEMPEKIAAPRSNISRRRRSITSDVSATSTADLTSDTGVSTPARTNSPSPRLLDTGFVPLAMEKHHGAPVQIVGSVPRRAVAPFSVRKQDSQPTSRIAVDAKDPAIQRIEKKRCISFACTAKPKDDAAKAPVPAPASTCAPIREAAVPAPTQPAPPRKPCIRFACSATQPARRAVQQTPPNAECLAIPNTDESGSLSTVVSTPATVRKARSPVARRRPMTPRRMPLSPAPVERKKKKYITASSDELQGEEYQFHEFASDHPTQEAWIRQESTARKGKLLIEDLLKKENEIRRLAKEAEEEEEAEEDDGEDNADEDDEGNAEDEDEDELEENVDDDESGYGSDDDFSDGYNTDEDLGFAESDDEEDDDLLLWTLTASQSYMEKFADATPVLHSTSLGAVSDSSVCSRRAIRTKRSRQQSVVARAVTPELPDSTDFVCGTMDEDRPLEEAYATRIAARKLEKLRAIPQDIDPSFPTSDREDDDEEEMHHSHDSGEPLWLHGELEELHDDRAGRRQRKHDVSPKRHRSPPPPKRYHSPPPKTRGRSPRRLFDHSSPKRVKSPVPAIHLVSPVGSPTHPKNGSNFQALAARPGLTHTKSLPRAGYFPAHIKNGKRAKVHTKDTAHVRGAIDIVKGLEQKRQRRKEKYHQKYCDRARKGQVPEKKKPRLGEGAERMRELGLISAGKRNYVISI